MYDGNLSSDKISSWICILSALNLLRITLLFSLCYPNGAGLYSRESENSIKQNIQF